jgi:hypothetical protein
VEEKMKYVLLICDDQSAETTGEEAAAVDRAAKAWDHEMTERGVLVQAQRLALAAEAKSVRVHGEEVLLWRGSGPSRCGSIGGSETPPKSYVW